MEGDWNYQNLWKRRMTNLKQKVQGEDQPHFFLHTLGLQPKVYWLDLPGTQMSSCLVIIWVASVDWSLLNHHL